MNQLRSKTDQIHDLEQQIKQLREELEKYKQTHQQLQQQHQLLKTQNERLLKMEAQHQSAQQSLIQKRVILSRAEILVPEHMVIGDRMENCVIKIYKGNNLIVTDRAELINCRIIGLDHYADETINRSGRSPGTIEIKGLFLNSNPQKFAISTHERVVIRPGARFRGNICAHTIIVSGLTRVRGRLATRELWEQYCRRKKARRIGSNVIEMTISK